MRKNKSMDSKATRHLRRAYELMHSKKPPRQNAKHSFGVVMHRLVPATERLEYPLKLNMTNPHGKAIKTTISVGHISFEFMNVDDGMSEDGELMKVEVIGSCRVMETSGLFNELVGQLIRVVFDITETTIMVDLAGHGWHFVDSTAYGSKFYEDSLKDMITSFFRNVMVLCTKYGKNDLVHRISEQDISQLDDKKHWRSLRDEINAALDDILDDDDINRADTNEANWLSAKTGNIKKMVMILLHYGT